VNLRRATEADEPVLRELWEEFEREVPSPFEAETWEEEWADTRRDVSAGLVYLAEDDEGVAGVARGELQGRALHVHLVHVRARARTRGVSKALLAELVREARERGAARVTLESLASNTRARSVWQRLGFEEVEVLLAAPVEALERRLGGGAAAAAFGSIHVQTDDREAVVRAVEKYRPRVVNEGSYEVLAPAGGWTALYDEVLEREPARLQHFARELSSSLGAVTVCFTIEQEAAVGYAMYDQGSPVDDYLSVPEIRGPLPPGDVIALEANPRVVQRLTGADPAAVRAVARTASSPAELPPPRELARQIAALMGIEGAARGFGA
jgi:ribosomal protein S18 acetylase RimI-like enzyme